MVIWKEVFKVEHMIVNEEIDIVEKRVIDFIHNKEFKVFDKIDQKAEADNVGLEIPETRLIIFGNPKVGTLLMQENNDITFELPIKILLIADGKQTKLIYRDPLNFPGHSQLQEKGKQIINKMHNMYQEMLVAAKG